MDSKKQNKLNQMQHQYRVLHRKLQQANSFARRNRLMSRMQRVSQAVMDLKKQEKN